MKKNVLIILLLFPIVIYAEIIKVELPTCVSEKDKQRAFELLNYFYDVKKENLQYDLNKISNSEYNYRGFFLKAKLIRNEEPIELFLYLKDGMCHACYEAGIAVLHKNDLVWDYVPISNQNGNINISFIKYDNAGTCVILDSNDDSGNGGISSYRKIIRLNSRDKFEEIYNNVLSLSDGFGWEENIGIGVTLTSLDSSGYRKIIIKERLDPRPIPTESVYYSSDKIIPEKVNQEVTISMKKMEEKDKFEKIEYFIKNLFKTKKSKTP